jgi:hypothetical protein
MPLFLRTKKWLSLTYLLIVLSDGNKMRTTSHINPGPSYLFWVLACMKNIGDDSSILNGVVSTSSKISLTNLKAGASDFSLKEM